jgi:hypothetical protein
LNAAAFADEVVLLDKGRQSAVIDSTPDSFRYYRASWSPTVEDTRDFALQRCSHDWIVCLDDDEIMSPGCATTFKDFVRADRTQILGVPIKHHILGRFDERAYYWPEWRPCLFRRGAISYASTVHGGTIINGSVERLRDGHEAFITHLSHPDVVTWVEKTNRYTSRPDRSGVGAPPPGYFIKWAVAALQAYTSTGGDDYLDAVAILRGVYDVIDGLKRWEATQPDGHAAFNRIAREWGGDEED